MSGNTEHTTDKQDIPVILLVHRAKAGLIKQTYENLMIISSGEGSAAEFFQANIKEDKAEALYGFLSEHDYLATEDAIEKIAKLLIEDPYIGAVYCDGIIRAHNDTPQIFPPFSKESYTTCIINTPLFAQHNLLQEWDEELNSTYFYDYYKKLGATTLVGHIPEPLILTKYNPTSSEEIQKVREKHG